MSDTVIGKIVILLLILLLGVLIIFKNVDMYPEGRVYDCGMADWHPDIPNAVRDECRRIRHEEWKKQNEKISPTILPREISA